MLTADDPEYEESRKVWNAMIDRRPGLVARCTGTVDVVQAVRFALPAPGLRQLADLTACRWTVP